jgi:hypothetical protein
MEPEPTSAAYLTMAAGQMGSISAFLGGFAATFLATLLIVPSRSRAAGVTIGGAAVSSVGFIVCVVGATTLVGGLHPDAPRGYNGADYLARVHVLMTLGFLVGMLALLCSVATSGWIRSRTMGRVTTGVSLAGLAAILFLTVRIGAG